MNKWYYKSKKNNITIIREENDYSYVTKENIINIKDDKVYIEKIVKNKQITIFEYLKGKG